MRVTAKGRCLIPVRRTVLPVVAEGLTRSPATPVEARDQSGKLPVLAAWAQVHGMSPALVAGGMASSM